jgi:hypothetical protein
MLNVRTLSAFAAGCVTAAGLGWGVNLSAAVAAGTQAATSSISVCIGGDGVLHLPGASRVCGPNEQNLQLQAVDGDGASTKGSKPNDYARRIADLEKRLSALEAQGPKDDKKIVKVVAPFEVVDRSGRPVFRVSEGDAALFNADGKRVAEMRATADGGYFIGKSAGASLATALGASGGAVGLRITEGNNTTTRLDLGRDPEHGTYRLKVISKSGQVLAGIGQGAANTGTAIVNDEHGVTRASMFVESDVPYIRLYGPSRTVIAALTQGKAGGGLLDIFSSTGERMVGAGMTEKGVGMVAAGPAGFKSGMGLLGLPGSYIVGKPK